jgi:sulfur carrier protein
MHITVNGQARDIASGRTVHDLVVSLNLDPAVVVAELNRGIVPGARFADTVLNDGDRLELLSFVGGG